MICLIFANFQYHKPSTYIGTNLKILNLCLKPICKVETPNVIFKWKKKEEEGKSIHLFMNYVLHFLSSSLSFNLPLLIFSKLLVLHIIFSSNRLLQDTNMTDLLHISW